MIKNKKISIIVLNYNGKKFLETCLPSIKKQSFKNYEVLIADNNSTDGSKKFIKENFPEFQIIENPDNYGYAKANNIAAKKANGALLLFLNNDTELFPKMLEKLASCYEEKSIINPAQIVEANKKIDFEGFSCSGKDIFGYPYCKLDKLGKMNTKKTKIFYADGAAILVSKKDFLDIGMFDEELFIFQEDIDFSWRAQMFGYKLKQCFEAKFYHYSGGTVSGGGSKRKRYESSYFRRYLNEKNVIRNILKNYSWLFIIFILPTLLFLHLIEIIVLNLTFNFKAAGCYFKAYWWNIINFKNTLKYRFDIQNKRTVSDWQLIKKMYFAYSKFSAFLKLGIPKFK